MSPFPLSTYAHLTLNSVAGRADVPPCKKDTTAFLLCEQGVSDYFAKAGLNI